MNTLRDRVFEDLNHSLENGYFEPGEMLHGSTAEEIAIDMIAFVEDVENETAETLTSHIQAWLDQRDPDFVASHYEGDF